MGHPPGAQPRLPDHNGLARLIVEPELGVSVALDPELAPVKLTVVGRTEDAAIPPSVSATHALVLNVMHVHVAPPPTARHPAAIPIPQPNRSLSRGRDGTAALHYPALGAQIPLGGPAPKGRSSPVANLNGATTGVEHGGRVIARDGQTGAA